MAQPPLRPQDAVMLIPSLEPDDRLPAYVHRLLDKGFQHVVIVDDGSSAAYQPIFAELDAMDGVWLPVVKDWRLNERHYGALQGLNKAETAEKYGEAQVKVWRWTACLSRTTS